MGRHKVAAMKHIDAALQELDKAEDWGSPHRACQCPIKLAWKAMLTHAVVGRPGLATSDTIPAFGTASIVCSLRFEVSWIFGGAEGHGLIVSCTGQ